MNGCKAVVSAVKVCIGCRTSEAGCRWLCDVMTAADLPETEPEYAGRYKDHFKIGGFKVFLDGSP